MKDLLGDCGAEVVHTTGSKEAKAALAAGGFALLVTDYSLGPGEQGDAVLKAAQELAPQTRRIMVSGTMKAEWVAEVGLAHAFYLKDSHAAGALVDEVEALSRQSPAL